MIITLSVPPFPYPPAAPVLTRAASVRRYDAGAEREASLIAFRCGISRTASRDDVQPSVLDMIGGDA